MKKHRIPALLLALFTVLAFTSCDFISDFLNSRMRSIDPIQIFNSRMEITRKLVPNDTLFVEVQGLIPGNMYDVECVDAGGNTITMLTAQADENGVIAPSPLWYDIGFENKTVKVTIDGIERDVKKPVLNTEEQLGLQAFDIQVTSKASDEDTSFSLTFWVVFKSDIERPEPIVMAGKLDNSGGFFLENSFAAGDALRLKVEPSTLKEPPAPIAPETPLNVYIVPYSAQPILDGTAIADLHPVTTEPFSFTVAALTDADGVEVLANIPATADYQGKAFSIILDVNNDGIYNVKKEGTEGFYLDGVDGNGVAGFIVLGPDAQTADLIHLNIASNGHFTWQSTGYDYGYADTFKRDGSDTQYGWDWQYQGYGVKAIWNPYINWGTPPDPATASFYYGTYVSLYIIDVTHSLTLDTPLDPTDGTSRMIVPVQSSCYNGCGQQTIWRTPLGAEYVDRDYCIFLDIDNDGFVSNDDMIDDLNQAGTTGTNGAGFRVIE